MTQYLKSDCTNNAYQELRISGLTVDPTPAENVTALRKLEAMANEFFKRNICAGYNFEDTPDLSSSAGIPPEYQESFEICLAVRLMSIFGKGAQDKLDPTLIGREAGAFSFLSASTAVIPRTQPSGRMPIGSGNERYSRTAKFYRQAVTPISGCATNNMIIDDINDFIEHFDSAMIDGELLATYTIEANTGLTIVSDSLSSTFYDVEYRIQADGANTDNPDGLYQVKIVATTDSGRVITRLIDFALVEVKIA